MVIFRLDPDHPPKLTPEEEKAWAELRELRDEDIDLSDTPEVTGPGWRRVSELIPEGNKEQVTLRLDADVLRFFKATGRRYQSRINAALREYMNAHRKTA
jgi:uncharacterized protein (DUF4415 family)